MRCEVVLFDLDGTLINSIDDISNAFNATLTAMGYPTVDKEVVKFYIGAPFKVRVISVLPEGQKDENIIPLFHEHFTRELRQRLAENTHPFEGISRMLDELIKFDIKIGILSSKNDNITRKIVAKLFPGIEFSIVRGLVPGAPEKPDPRAAKQVANELGVTLENIVFVGDTIVDMKTAVASGMFPIGVAWGYQPTKSLKENGARIILDHPMELIEFLAL